jgi:hypothetical protein
MDDQVRRRAGSMSDVDWREMDEKNDRWSGFSDEELQVVADRLAAGLFAQDPSQKTKNRARMIDEINAVFERREAERSSYRGPGIYQSEGRDYEVLGTIGSPDVMQERTQVVLRRVDGYAGILMQESLVEFNKVYDLDGRRRYEYIGPLKRDVVPTEIKLVDAGEDWAVLETFDRKRFRLVKSDTFTVPTLVIS